MKSIVLPACLGAAGAGAVLAFLFERIGFDRGAQLSRALMVGGGVVAIAMVVL